MILSRRHVRIWTRRAAVAAAIALGAVSCKNSTDIIVVLSMLPTSVPALEVGQTVQLTLAGAVGPVTWSSSNEAVATVLTTGFVTERSARQRLMANPA